MALINKFCCKPESIIETEQVIPPRGVLLKMACPANMFGAVPVMIAGTGFKMNNLSDEMMQLSGMQGDMSTH